MAKQYRVIFKSKDERKAVQLKAERDIRAVEVDVPFPEPFVLDNLKKVSKEDKKTLIFKTKNKTKKKDLEKYIEKAVDSDEKTNFKITKKKDEEEKIVNYFEPVSFTSCHSIDRGCH